MECHFEPFSMDWRDTTKLTNTLVALWCKCCDVRKLPYSLKDSYSLQPLHVAVTSREIKRNAHEDNDERQSKKYKADPFAPMTWARMECALDKIMLAAQKC
jgi:hypothetical protein